MPYLNPFDDPKRITQSNETWNKIRKKKMIKDKLKAVHERNKPERNRNARD